MPVTLGITRAHEFTGNDLNGRASIFARDPRNFVFVQLTDFRTKRIAAQPGSYLAFPFAIKVGASVLVLHSDGDSHAASARQVLSRSDDGGVTWTSVVFTENGSGIFDTSLLVGLLSPGQSLTLKVWTVTNTAGVLGITTVSTVTDSGVVYALWSRPIAAAAGSTLYRTGYGTSGGNTQTALLQSTDGGVSWTFRSLMFASPGLNFSEADVVRTSGNNLVAVCREDSGASNPLYYSTSADDGATWSAPVLIPTTVINGRQPNLIKTANGRYILCTGDRAGSSGIGGGGEELFGTDKTGIAMVTSADAINWGSRTMLAGMYSTDGGQPFSVEISNNRVLVVYYQRRGINEQPVVASSTLDTGEL